jgi:hypothetical protein
MKAVVSWSRSKVLLACALTPAVAGCAVLVAVGTGSNASASSTPAVTQSDYSALGGTSIGDASALMPPSASAGEGNRPIGSSATVLNLGKPNLVVTITRSSEGGVCVFVERHGARGGGGSCGTAALLKSGETAEVHEQNAPTVLAGVVPDGVSAVKVTFVDGSSQTVTVVDNGWAIEAAPNVLASTTDITGG